VHADVSGPHTVLAFNTHATQAMPGATKPNPYKHSSFRTSIAAAPVAAAAVTAFPLKAAAAAPVTAAAAALPVTAAAPAAAIAAWPSVHAAAAVGCCGWVPVAVAAAALRLHLLAAALAGAHKLALDGRLQRQLLQGGRDRYAEATMAQVCV
jgi:hypothetical protein